MITVDYMNLKDGSVTSENFERGGIADAMDSVYANEGRVIIYKITRDFSYCEFRYSQQLSKK